MDKEKLNQELLKTNNLNRAKELIEKGADVNARDKYGQTPLIIACGRQSKHANIELIKYLIEKGANVNATGEDEYHDQTPIMMAIRADYLIRSVAMQIIDILLKAGADINAATKSDKITALTKASRLGHLSITKFLVEHGANLNAQDSDGWTPLMYAINSGRFDVVRYLVENGADINYKNKFGWTAIDLSNDLAYDNINKYGENNKVGIGYLNMANYLSNKLKKQYDTQIDNSFVQSFDELSL